MKAKKEMMQGIQMAKELAQKELSDQKELYEEKIRSLESQLVHKTAYFSLLILEVTFRCGQRLTMSKCCSEWGEQAEAAAGAGPAEGGRARGGQEGAAAGSGHPQNPPPAAHGGPGQNPEKHLEMFKFLLT